MANNLIYVLQGPATVYTATHNLGIIMDTLYGDDKEQNLAQLYEANSVLTLMGFEVSDGEKQFTIYLWGEDPDPDANSVWVDFIKRYEPDKFEMISSVVDTCRKVAEVEERKKRGEDLWAELKYMILDSVKSMKNLVLLSDAMKRYAESHFDDLE